jgi:hypothetical protein
MMPLTVRVKDVKSSNVVLAATVPDTQSKLFTTYLSTESN